MSGGAHVTTVERTADGAVWSCSCGSARREFKIGTTYMGRAIDTQARAESFAKASAAFHRINEALAGE